MKGRILLKKSLILFTILLIYSSVLNSQCNGYKARINKISDGFYKDDIKLQATITGGSGSINYVEWSPIGYGITIDYRSAGTHRAIVKDTFYGCVDTAYITVTDTFNCMYLKPTFYETDSCSFNDIKLTASIPIGSGTYSYKWSSGETTSEVFSKASGTYSLTVTDLSYNCKDSIKKSIVDDTCNFCKNFYGTINELDNCLIGDVALEAYANTHNYHQALKYLWNTGSTAQKISSQTHGIFNVIIKDTLYNCIDTINYTIYDDTCKHYIYKYDYCKSGDVSVYVTPIEYETFNYLWNTGDTVGNLNNLTSGTYSVIITHKIFGYKDTLRIVIADTVYKCCSADFYLTTDSFQTGNTLLGFNNYFMSSAYSNNNIFKYNWSFGDTIDGSGRIVYHQYAHTGTKTICHYIQDDLGCADTLCRVMNMPPNGPNLAVKTFHTTIVPGQTVDYYILYSNLGNFDISNAQLKFRYPNGMTIGNVSTFYSQSGDTITFNLGQLYIGQHGYIKLNLMTPANYVVGSIKSDTTLISPLVGDVIPKNNISINHDDVKGSYDPNEIIVSPNGEGDDGNIHHLTKELSYLIRFQNEGNWRTYKVRVENDVDTSLDLSSLALGKISHPVRLIVRGRTLVWNFDNINLSPKSIDEPNSHGFINYTIKLRKNLPVGRKIKNKAGIYFDYNDPIITNTTISTLSLKVTNSLTRDIEDNLDFELIKQNGIYSLTSTNNIEDITIFNIEGKLLLNQTVKSNQKNLEFNFQENMIYVVQVKIGNAKVIKKIAF
jgi:uncharacterized repeat protein (TIGR01451 family)